MRALTITALSALLALPALAAGCSAVIDSDQYLGGGGGVDGGGLDGGTDSGPGTTDGGPDAGEDLCEGVTCGASEMCDPLTGDCIESCDPACPADEVCTATGCMDCDVDSDGAFLDGARCAPLRGTDPPDCNDDDADVYPGARPVCGDGKINSCPDEGLDRVIEAASPVEVGRIPPFQVEGVTVADRYPWLSITQNDEARGYVGFMGTTGAGIAEYDVTSGTTAVRGVEGLVTVRTDLQIAGVVVGFTAAAGRIGLLFESTTGGSPEVGLWDYDGTTAAPKALEPVSSAVGPLAIGRAPGSGAGAVVVRGVDPTSSDTNALVYISESDLQYLPNSRISTSDGYLDVLGSFGLAAANTATSSYMIADEFDAQEKSLTSPIVGSPGTVLFDSAGPVYLSAFPTNAGIFGLLTRCTGGFPLDFAACTQDTVGPFGPTSLTSGALAMARANDLAFAAVGTPAPGVGSGQQLTAFVIRSDGMPVGGASPLAFPLLRPEDVGGGAPVIRDVVAYDRFFGGEGVLMVYAANVSGEVWITGMAQCAER